MLCFEFVDVLRALLRRRTTYDVVLCALLRRRDLLFPRDLLALRDVFCSDARKGRSRR